MKEYGAFEAKTHLSALLDLVEQGERIRITRRGIAVALLIPLPEEPAMSASEAAATLRELREEATLGDVSLRELIEEGRR